MMNQCPVKGGIFDTIFPTTIMIGVRFHYKNNLGLLIGKYFQVQEEDTPCDSNHPHTKHVVCMGPSRNILGGFKSMSLR